MNITRSTTEVFGSPRTGAGELLALDLKRGDEVISTNQNYPRMITSWQQRAERDGADGGADQAQRGESNGGGHAPRAGLIR